ncbi:DUF3244 domain-containing protein [uncultured Bacteroides sp.]|uniref:DUF3244 domain-containing protein n=1 Tax=uncultured Bacteroides sp. TaxID=162156 RepID=UPI0025B71936|nr:DUF3244 domain-containing protein [uncultured Bacteroides sp.]
MKTKRVKKQSVHIALIASIVMCFLFISKGYSSIFEITPIETKGTWNNSNEDNKIDRSLPTIPISAYLSGNFINIQNNKPDCDITIRIICPTTGETQYQQMIPETATANILIPISNLPSGIYLLELTGPGNRHLEGNFHK